MTNFRKTIPTAIVALLILAKTSAALAPNEKAAWELARQAFELTSGYGVVDERTPEEFDELAVSGEVFAVDYINKLRFWYEELLNGEIVDERSSDYQALERMLRYLLEKAELLLTALEEQSPMDCASSLGTIHRLTPTIAESFGYHDY